MAIFFPTYDEILKLKVKPEIGELHLLNFLKHHLDDSFEIFFNPFLNGDRPDVIVMKENQGVLIIEVKDYQLDSYELDERKHWLIKKIHQHIKSPISQVLQYKENLFDLHIENLLAKKISNIKNFNIVSCAVYFHNATSNELFDFIIKPFEHDKKYLDFLKYNIQLIGRNDLTETTFDNILKNSHLISNQTSIYFSNDIYKSFKRFLNPPYHFKEQVEKEIPYTKKQLEIIYGGKEKKEQRIKGVVGSGKTTVLAARAVQAFKRTDEEVLILTYNITLKNYIKDKINKVREDFSWTNFIILNYHLFINTELNNIGVEIKVPENFDENTEEFKEDFFEKSYYSNLSLFEKHKEKLKKYSSIFIDEIQDYKRRWMDIIKTYFLKEGGEYVLFGDVKQNIYNNKIINKDVNTNVYGVNELRYSFRSDYKIQDLTVEFQSEFFKDKYDIDNKKDFTSTLEIDFEKKQLGAINYIFLSDVDSVVSLYTIIHQNAINKGIQPNDITILGNTISLLKKFDAYYRYSSNEKTNTMFETNEMIFRYGINFIGKTSVEWLTDFKKLIKRENDKNTEKANNQISILLTLYELYLEYQGQFKEKLEYRCKAFNTTFPELTLFLEKYKNEISEFKSTYNSKTLNKNLKFIRDNKKINFYMNSGTVKISTIHSFKGWECENLFLIIEKRISISFDEILYTGITRSRTNLIIINYGNAEYNDKLNKLIDRVK